MVWIVAVAIVAIIGIAVIAAPPWPLGRPSHDEATIWLTALTGAGTLAAVAVALWSGASSQRQGEHFRHDAIRPALTTTLTWRSGERGSGLWLNVSNWGQQAAVNLRIAVVIETPRPMVRRLPLFHGDAQSRSVVLLPYGQQRMTNQDGKGYFEYHSNEDVPAEDNSGHIIFWYEDILGWTWESMIPVTFGGPGLSNGAHQQVMEMSEPKAIPHRLSGWPGESGGEVIVK